MTEQHQLNGGAGRLAEIIAMLPMADPRDDIDTESLLRRFPYLADVRIEDLTIEGPHGPVAARRYTGPSATGVGLVWVHGGAFIAGSLDMPESNWVGMELARRGVPVLALEYHKALEGVHHPVLSDDVLAGWTVAADLLGVPVENLHLGGASAGANLSAGVAVRVKDGSQAGPASLVLVYPVLHPVLPDASEAAAAAAAAIPDQARFAPDFVRAISLNYVGGQEHLADPVAFPANAELDGMPPTLIINAEGDDLRASGEAFAAQLASAGVPVVLEFEPGTMHGYLDNPGDATALASIELITTWLLAGGK